MKWTDDDINTLIEMRNRGCAYKEIAAVLERTATECREKMNSKKSSLKYSAERRAETAALADRIRGMFEVGMGDREICEELNIGANMLNGIKRMHDIKRTPKQQALLISRLNSARAHDANNMPANKKTICWTCTKAMVKCKKPVEGFKAEKVLYGNDLPPRYTYFVSECPEYDPEPYANKRSCDQ